MDLLRGDWCLSWPVSIPEGYYCFAKCATGAIHGKACILEHLAESLDRLDCCGAIGHLAVPVKPIVAGNDGNSGIVGSLCSRDDSGKGIQRNLDNRNVPASLIGFVNQGLCPGDELISFGKPVTLALVDSFLTGPDLFQVRIIS